MDPAAVHQPAPQNKLLKIVHIALQYKQELRPPVFCDSIKT